MDNPAIIRIYIDENKFNNERLSVLALIQRSIEHFITIGSFDDTDNSINLNLGGITLSFIELHKTPNEYRIIKMFTHVTIHESLHKAIYDITGKSSGEYIIDKMIGDANDLIHGM